MLAACAAAPALCYEARPEALCEIARLLAEDPRGWIPGAETLRSFSLADDPARVPAGASPACAGFQMKLQLDDGTPCDCCAVRKHAVGVHSPHPH